MTRESALLLLAKGSSHDRLKAARYLSANGTLEDLAPLSQARRTESVSYIKNSLDLAIRRLGTIPIQRDIQPTDEDDFVAPAPLLHKLRAEATEWVAGLLLHEISSPIGLIQRSAMREIPEYARSQTKKYIDNVKRIFEGIEQLQKASANVKLSEFDLTALLGDIASVESASIAPAVEISMYGPRPLLIYSDDSLIRLVFANGLRNALESVASVEVREPHPLIVTWGATNSEYWISINDKGKGISGPREGIFEIGRTTKSAHSGFGLAIAKQAIENLGGKIIIEPNVDKGVRFEARWEK